LVARWFASYFPFSMSILIAHIGLDASFCPISSVRSHLFLLSPAVPARHAGTRRRDSVPPRRRSFGRRAIWA